MSKSFKVTLIVIAVAQLLVTTVVAYVADAEARSATLKACYVGAVAAGIDFETCVEARLK